MNTVYGDQKVLCLILARGGSRGIPRKNVKLLMGKPLITHSIDVARSVPHIDQVYVSTDDEEIMNISIDSGAKVINRPSQLATDTATSLAAAQHALESIRPHPDSIIVFLQVTSPIRSSADVRSCIELLNDQFDCVMSIIDVKTHPAHMFEIKDQLLVRFDETIEYKNRQEMKKLCAHNGSIVVTTAKFLQNQKTTIFGGRIKGYLLDQKFSIDIDTQFDFDLCELILKYWDKK